MAIEEQMVRYAAPTLAGCKVANLINLPQYIASRRDLSYCQRCLACNGVNIHVLLEKGGRKLIFVYRRTALQRLLNECEVQVFLAAYGYMDFSVEAALDQLARHCATQGNFPHEIGIFLGYPLSDVQAFIIHQGQNAKLTGYWKVYGNEEEARKTFSLYSDCQIRLFAKYRQGVGLADLSAIG